MGLQRVLVEYQNPKTQYIVVLLGITPGIFDTKAQYVVFMGCWKKEAE